MTTDTDTSDEIIDRPARAWRNWYRAHRKTNVYDVATRVFIRSCEAGDVFGGKRVHPSKEIAEEYAAKVATADLLRGDEPNEYLGAYPEGTRP